MAAGRETMHDLDAGRQPRRIGARILVDRHRAVGAVGRGHEPQPPALVLVGERLLLVAGRDAARGRLDPDLQEVHGLGRRGVELAVAHAGAGTHALHVAGPDHRAGAEAVAMLEAALQHVGDDLHVPMGVGREALARRDPILVDHAQRTEADEPRIVVAGERERVPGVEPPVVGVSPVRCLPHHNGHTYWTLAQSARIPAPLEAMRGRNRTASLGLLKVAQTAATGLWGLHEAPSTSV